MITKEQIRTAIEEDALIPDGHGIFAPAMYENYFPVREWGLVQTFESDFSNPKYTIFDHNGQPIEKMEGVYNLMFLERLSRETGLNYRSSASGRGFAAQDIFRALKAWAYDKED